MAATGEVTGAETALTLSIDGDGVAWLVFDVPGSRVNILSTPVMAQLDAALAEVEEGVATGRIKALVVRSGKPATFIAGADIEEIRAITDVAEAERGSREGQRIFRRIERLAIPSIAAIDGACMGGGTELALACTYRLASDRPETRIGLPEVRLGIIPGYGGTVRLPRLIGKGRALELILTGEMIDAAEAHRIGLVNRVVPQADLIAEAEAFLRTITANGPIAVALALESVERGLTTTVEDGLVLESNLFGLLASTSDMREGMTAFLEKRKPVFHGK